MNIIESTRHYEKWLEEQLERDGLGIERSALKTKHVEMAATPFGFLRATFYHWMKCWPATDPVWRGAPPVLAVGDLHAENFGTWRDAEGRLVWGINDFDEAYWLPYSNDLVRLATSIELAIEDDQLSLSLRDACTQILAGYDETLRRGRAAASPLILSDGNSWLAEIAEEQVRTPAQFWEKLSDPKTPKLNAGQVPLQGRRAIRSHFPLDAQIRVWKKRVTGLGSLGRPRFVAVGLWQGGRLAREGKALIPSAVRWAQGELGTESYVVEIMDHAVRCPDPEFTVIGRWLVRRLSPDCNKLKLSKISRQREKPFLRAMGRETANIHLGTPESIPAILEHLGDSPKNWLEEAARQHAEQVRRDFKDWREHQATKVE